jgi:hypothetical protein
MLEAKEEVSFQMHIENLIYRHMSIRFFSLTTKTMSLITRSKKTRILALITTND